MAGAIATGAILAVLVTAAGRGIASVPQPPVPSTVALTDGAATVAPGTPAQATVAPTASPPPSMSPVPSPSASTDLSGVGLPPGCFSDGLSRESEVKEPIVAEDLQRRLPVPHWSSEAVALVGSSANGLFVSAFSACTRADPANIRWGTVSGGVEMIPQAVQVDGFSGAQLAEIMLAGYLPPEHRVALEIGRHAGWTYLYLDQQFAITASADTVYWYWVPPCCYEGPIFTDHTFVDVLHRYLDLTRDVGAEWR